MKSTTDKPTGKGWSKGKEFVPRAICKICGEKFYTAPCYKKRGENHGTYCSKACKGKAMSDEYDEKFAELREQKQLETNTKNQKQKKKQTICETCGKETKNTKFCNRKCYTKNKEKFKMSKCLNCESEYKILNWEHKAGVHQFCSISCAAQYRNKNTAVKTFSSGKGGKRADLDNRYFRSRWEANYARYLNFLIKHGEIDRWEFEPDTFIFEKITRGTRSYLPDFKVFYKNGQVAYHEVKGWNSPESKTKLKRMAKYYPEVKVELIDKGRYMTIHRQMKSIIPFWESDPSPKKAYLFK